jgi:quercetin dioxygenase-like cupin family protein
MKRLLSIALAVGFLQGALAAQSVQKPTALKPVAPSAAELELKEFYDTYADDIRQGRGLAIAGRYDSRGYYRMGNGAKQLVSLEEAKKTYTTRWTAPKTFEWRDLSFEVLSPTTAAVAGLFDWQPAAGPKGTYSYSASLTKESGQWRIRVEDESTNTAGYATAPISGDRNKPGTFKYSLTAQPGASISAHRHTSEMKITVKSGRKFILMGDLDAAKVQVFESGATFTIPANTWHVEWWENETVEEIEVTSPSATVRAGPATPRKP